MERGIENVERYKRDENGMGVEKRLEVERDGKQQRKRGEKGRVREERREIKKWRGGWGQS